MCLKGVHPYIFKDLKCHKQTYGDFQYSYNLKYSFPMLYDCVNVHGWANYIITILLYIEISSILAITDFCSTLYIYGFNCDQHENN